MGDVNLNERQVFLEALDQQSPEELLRFLDDACGDDGDLRSRVEALLRAHQQMGSFLCDPLFGDATVAGSTAEQPGTGMVEVTGTRIGPYMIREQISHGGFGVVYVAEQEHPVARKVALKIIKPGMDTTEIIARFEAERQALAMMDHPNVAKVLDAGATESGRPYFVMELIHGFVITEFCDEHRLTNRERLQLFVDVCRAVQHAHQKGIIHRDLKPSNIMVTMHDDRPVPKVIDFGVAKALNCKLTDKTVYTAYGQMIGTPLYMSPEQLQLSGMDVDTRSDVYSLGVLLYELLTGVTPFDKETLRKAGLDEFRRIIREDDPPRPSDRVSTLNAELGSTASERRGVDHRSLCQSLRGELDWIVVKTLEKDRDGRYESANALADDVERYLADLPVQAGPPSRSYRLKKFVRRNKRSLAVGATLGFALLTVVGAVTGSLGWLARDRAMREARLTAEVKRILADVERFETHQAWPQAIAAAKRAESVLTSGDADRATQRRVQRVLSDLRFVGQLDAARLAPDALERDHAYTRVFAGLQLTADTITPENAAALVRDSRPLAPAIAANLTEWALTRKRLSEAGYERTWSHLLVAADVLHADRWRKRVRAALQQGTGSRVGTLKDLALTADIKHLPASTAVLLAGALLTEGNVEEAINLLHQSQRFHPSDFWLNDSLAYCCREARPRRTAEAVAFYRVALSLRPDSSRAWNNLGVVLRDARDLTEAIACHRRALELDPRYPGARGDLGICLAEQGNREEAITHLLKAVEIDPLLATTHRNLAKVFHDGGQLDKAIESYRTAIDLDPRHTKAYVLLANVLQEKRQTAEAIKWLREAIEIEPGSSLAHHDLGNVYARQGDFKTAAACYRKSIELDPDSPRGHFSLGNILRQTGQLDQAVLCYRKALALAPNLDPADRTEKTAQIQMSLGAALQLSGSLAEAIECYREAARLSLTLPTADRGAWSTQIHVALGLALADDGSLDEAIASFKTAIELDPNDLRAYVNLGSLLQSHGRTDEAAPLLRKVLELQPDWAIRARKLGDALARHGRLNEAIDCYRKTIAVDPVYAPAYAALGNMLMNQGLVEEAAANFREAIELAPERPGGYQGLARLMIQRRDVQKALEFARRAVELDQHDSANWDLLSVACYRAGLWQESLDARAEKIKMTKAGLDDQLYMAMTQWQLEHSAIARGQVETILANLASAAQLSSNLQELCLEAEQLMGTSEDNQDDVPQ